MVGKYANRTRICSLLVVDRALNAPPPSVSGLEPGAVSVRGPTRPCRQLKPGRPRPTRRKCRPPTDASAWNPVCIGQCIGDVVIFESITANSSSSFQHLPINVTHVSTAAGQPLSVCDDCPMMPVLQIPWIGGITSINPAKSYIM